MQFIQFFIDDQPALGSDGVMPLDGRLNLNSAIMAGAKQARRLRKVQPRYNGLRVMEGAHSLTQVIPIMLDKPDPRTCKHEFDWGMTYANGICEQTCHKCGFVYEKDVS